MINTLLKTGVNKGTSIICQQTIVTLATDQRDKLKTQLTFKNLTPTHYFLLCSFYVMVYAWTAYADGNLQFFGNVHSVELDGECTGSQCLTEGGVPPPPAGGGGK